MKKPIWPIVLVVVGYALLALCITLIKTMDLSDTGHMWAIIGENFGVGLGSVGLGMLVATRRR